MPRPILGQSIGGDRRRKLYIFRVDDQVLFSLVQDTPLDLDMLLPILTY